MHYSEKKAVVFRYIVLVWLVIRMLYVWHRSRWCPNIIRSRNNQSNWCTSEVIRSIWSRKALANYTTLVTKCFRSYTHNIDNRSCILCYFYKQNSITLNFFIYLCLAIVVSMGLGFCRLAEPTISTLADRA